MKIAVIGSGAIGNLVAGYLKLKGDDVFLIGRSEAVRAIKSKGLAISGARGNFNVTVGIFDKLEEAVDLVVLAVKTQDIEKALKENLEFLKESYVLTLQNGIRADEIASKYIPKQNIISSIVMFGSTYLEPACVVHNFEGNWIIGSMFAAVGASVRDIGEYLNDIFPVVITDDIKGMKYLKLFVNAHNCVAAILGVSMQEAFSNIEISRISIAIWKEALEVVGKCNIKLVSLPDFSVERLTGLVAMDTVEAAKKFSFIITNLSKEPVYGSILQSIKRGRSSEIDYINGEFVELARKNGLDAPLNGKLVEMVHEVEKTGRFFGKEELLKETKKLVY